jgi:hypothetical protein
MNKQFIIGFSFCTILIFSFTVNSQTNTKNPYSNSWFMFMSQITTQKKWASTIELHERTGKFLNDHGQILIRPSLDYIFNSNISASLGYTFIHNDPYTYSNFSVPINENNCWEQLLFKFKISNLILQNRIRLEHRWIEKVSLINDEKVIEGYQFKNRFRFRFDVQHKLFQIRSKDVFCHGFNEIWLGLDNEFKLPNLSRNWVYIGLGLKIDENSNLQFGYMRQLDLVDLNTYQTDIIQLTYIHNFNLK